MFGSSVAIGNKVVLEEVASCGKKITNEACLKKRLTGFLRLRSKREHTAWVTSPRKISLKY